MLGKTDFETVKENLSEPTSRGARAKWAVVLSLATISMTTSGALLTSGEIWAGLATGLLGLGAFGLYEFLD